MASDEQPIMTTDTDTITLTRAEHAKLLNDRQDAIDARDHAIAMRDVASGAMPVVPVDQVDAYLEARTPLAFWRRYRGLTQVQLANTLGIAQPSLAKAEQGATGLSVTNLAKAAKALGVRMEDLNAGY